MNSHISQFFLIHLELKRQIHFIHSRGSLENHTYSRPEHMHGKILYPFSDRNGAKTIWLIQGSKLGGHW